MNFFVVIAVTHFLALLSPGPDFFLLLMTLLRYSHWAAYRVAWGIALGNAFILGVLILLLNTLGQLSSDFLFGLRYVGALYLFYLSGICICYAHHHLKLEQPAHQQMSVEVSWRSLLGMGLQSSLLNPKNWMFYSGLMILLPQQTSVIYKISVSIWMVMVVLIWNISVVTWLTQPQWLQYLQRYTSHIYYLSGICFSIFAVVLLCI
ncbi:LysE family translocator [Acinetobacter sp. ANC 5383]